MSHPTDCLVLKIEEFDKEDGSLDHSLFVFYDPVYHKYILRGKRNDTECIQSEPYSFECNDSKDVYDWIDVMVGFDNTFSIYLYNYDHLPYDSNDIYYSFLETSEDESYTIVVYDTIEKSNPLLLKMIRLLKRVRNYVP